ncbi:MAG: hypothetical protein ABIK11_06515 [candidate division WOR-3 bacterium]
MRFARLLSFLLPVFILLILFSACARHEVKPAERFVTVFVSSGLTPEGRAGMAKLVAEIRGRTPVIWIDCSFTADTGGLFLLSDGELLTDLPSAAGCDVVLLTSDWLGFGVNRLKLLVDRARLRVLCANLEDSLGMPVAHPWMTRNAGGISFGITALYTDTSDWRRYQQGLRLISPEYAARKISGLIARNTDFRLLILPAGASGQFSGYDLTLTAEPGRVFRYDLVFLGSRLNNLTKTELDLNSLVPEPAVQQRIDSLLAEYETRAQAPVIESRVKIPPRILRKAVIDGLMDLRLAEVIVYDTLRLVRDTIFPGMITQRRLAEVFTEPGRWALVQLEGSEIRQLASQPGLKIETRKNLPGGRLMAHKRYRVMMPASLLEAHPEIYTRGFEFTLLPLYQYAADILQAQGKR